jgi:hypothetical protein
MQTGSAMIDLPTIEGTASSRLPWGLLLARLGDDHSRELQPGPLPWGLLLLARLGDDHSRELQPGPLPWGLLLLARSALITRSNSNQVPWDPWLCTMLARSAMIDLPTIALFNPSMEGKYSDSDSSSSSSSSSENCPN